MSKYDLSILIPARSERWLPNTVEDIIKNSSEKTEAIVVLDGEWIDGIPEHPRVTVVYLQKSIGQRAATNLACRLSKARYVAKTDAHCVFDKNFDTILMEDMQDNMVVVPVMKNLHAFDWVCEKGHRRYQGPSGPCLECKGPTKMDVIFKPRDKTPSSKSYCFDSEPHFQYNNDWTKTETFKSQGTLTETMSLQGSFFMCTRKKYWELDISSDKDFGSWGSQGLEISNKFFLTGGTVRCNHRTWYAHLFRTQGGDFSFPYPQDHSKTLKNRAKSKEMFFQANWKKQIYPLSMILEKFWPIKAGRGWTNEDYIRQKAEELKINRSGIASIEHRPSGKYWVLGCDNIRTKCLEIESLLNQGKHPHSELQELWNKDKGEFWWHVERFCRKDQVPHYEQQYIDKILSGEFKPHPRIAYEPPLTKGILYYTDGELDEKIAKPVRDQIKKSGLPITAVSLKPISFGDTNIHFKGKRGVLTMAKQILAGLEAMKETIVYTVEHDCWYPVSHFQGMPTSKDVYAYNLNVFKVNMEKMYGLKVDDCRQLSGMCAYRETLLNHYRKRVKMLEEGISARLLGFEPGTHNRKEKVDDLKSETWSSYEPILDLRVNGSLTRTKWRREDFRNQKYTEGWTETELVPSHGKVKDFLTKQGMI
jgi:glycosyltransferase involved in cell wall biosynthesis